MSLTAKDVMSPQVLQARADWSIDRLADFLVDNGISGAPVLDDDQRLVGVVSTTDLVRQRSEPTDAPATATAHAYYVNALSGPFSNQDVAEMSVRQDSAVSVRDIMTPMLFTVFPDTPVREVADTMRKGSIHRLFVTEGKKLVGVVSALDLLSLIPED